MITPFLAGVLVGGIGVLCLLAGAIFWAMTKGGSDGN